MYYFPRVVQVLAWSAFSPDDFHREDRYVVGGGGLGKTQHAVWDPVAGTVTGMLVADTNHDMFCPGITMMENGDIMVTGGQNAKKASIYQLASNTWNEAPEMDISRGYGSSALLSDGRVSKDTLKLVISGQKTCYQGSAEQTWLICAQIRVRKDNRLWLHTSGVEGCNEIVHKFR